MTAIIDIKSSNLFTTDPTPTAEAPHDKAKGHVTSLKPDALIIGIWIECFSNSLFIAKVAANVGTDFSNNPCIPELYGWVLVPPSVWIMSTPSKTNLTARSTCLSKGIVWGTVTDSGTLGKISLVSFVRFKIFSSEKVIPFS